MPLSLRSYHDRTARVRASVQAQLVAVWNALPNYRDADVDRFVRIATPKVQAGQFATARLTAQHLGTPVMPREQIITARKVAPSLEYRRPAVAVYRALSAGKPFTDSVASGTQRLTSLVSMDMQLALVAQSQFSLKSRKATHFRRVLTGSENCPLCQIASTNVYSTDDLMPIHDNCDCTVEPIYDDSPPAADFDVSDLLLTTGRQDELVAGASPQSLVAVHDHGEIGPVLTWASDHFTGPDEIHIVTDGVHK